MAWLSGWSYRKKIAIQQTYLDGDLTDFPLLVALTAAGAGSGLGSKILDAGQDIRFTQSDGSTLLKYEIESYSETSGNVTANVWVKVPSIASTGDATCIYLYYGKAGESDGQDAANVWDSSFVSVWHLGGTSDSKGAHALTDSGTSDVAGIAGRGRDLEVSENDYLSAGTINLSGAQVTIEAWINPESFQGSSPYMNYIMGTEADSGAQIRLINSGGALQFNLYLGAWGDQNSSVGFSIGNWHHVAGVYDGANQMVYVNGVLRGSRARTGDLISNNTFWLGRYHAGGRNFDGIFDEMRVSTIGRSAAWLKFTHRNIVESDNELAWGGEETVGGPFPHHIRRLMQGGMIGM
jgi:hypothetical protein